MSENLEKKEKSFISFIMLPHSCYDSKDISNEELTILALLHRNYNNATSRSICSIKMLIDYMRKDSRIDRTIVKTIKEAIKSLMSKKYKYKYKDIKDKKDYIIEEFYITELRDIYYNLITIDDIKNIDFIFYIGLTKPKSQFIRIDNIDIDKIFEHIKGVSLNKFALVRYYIACRRVMQNEANFGFITQSKLKSLITDSKSIQRYNKILQDDLNLIRYCNDYLTPDKHYCSTFVGLYEDEKSFNSQVKYIVDAQGLIPTDKTKSNQKRSTKQKINGLTKKELENNLLKEEIEKLKAENEKYKELQYKESKKDKKKRIEKEDAEIVEGINDLYGANQYEEEEEQMNPDDIVPESLKITQEYLQKQEQNDELDIWDNDEIDINSIWGEEKVEAKKCIICKEYYTEVTDVDDWCQSCIDENRIVKRYRGKF